MLLFDCDYRESSQTNGTRMRRKIDFQNGHPVEKGIENLFSRTTLEKAIAHNRAFIDVEPERLAIYDGAERTIRETWWVNENRKTNLCNWLCENGTVDDFQHFNVIFDLLGEAFGGSENQECNSV